MSTEPQRKTWANHHPACTKGFSLKGNNVLSLKDKNGLEGKREPVQNAFSQTGMQRMRLYILLGVASKETKLCLNGWKRLIY